MAQPNMTEDEIHNPDKYNDSVELVTLKPATWHKQVKLPGRCFTWLVVLTPGRW